MKNTFLIALLAVAVSLCFATGCGKGPKRVPITGTVTFGDDNQTVDVGMINFIPTDGNGQTEGGTIVDGKFEAEVSTGEKTVQVYGSQKTGEKVKPDPFANPDYEVDKTKDIPAKVFKEEIKVNIEKKNQVVEIHFSGNP